MGKQFQRRVENFACQNCGALIIGNGYTNHCTHCLWSRHVDQYPGDRAESCDGMMQPILLEGSSPNYRILHRCMRCGFERVNAVQPDDSSDAILALARNPHPTMGRSFSEETGKEFDPLASEHSYPEAELGEMHSNIKRRHHDEQ
jgi:hypothetical protein